MLVRFLEWFGNINAINLDAQEGFGKKWMSLEKQLSQSSDHSIANL